MSYKLQPYYARNDPFRSPAWRHHRALSIIETESKRCSSQDDDVTRAYKQFLVARIQAGESNSVAQGQVYRKFEALATAYELYASRTTRSHVALVLESRLLAGYDDREIASSSGTIPDAINAYEQLFFNVRDRLSCQDWVMTAVLAPAIVDVPISFTKTPFDPGAFAAPFYDATLKYFSYFYGRHMCEFMIHGARRDLRLNSQEEILNFVETDYRHKLFRRGLMAIQTMPIGLYNATDVLNAFTQVMALRAQADDEEKEKSKLHQNISAFLTSSPWSSGKPKNTSGVVDAYHDQAAELRVSEQLRLGSGEELDFSYLADIRPPDVDNSVTGASNQRIHTTDKDLDQIQISQG